MKNKNLKFSSEKNPYTTIMTPAQYAEWRASLAKRANTRLKALETSSSKITGERYTYGAYKKYAADVLNMEKPRFSQSKQVKDVNTMRHEILVLQRFLNAKSSTISGNREIEKARIKTFESGVWGAIKFDEQGKPFKSERIKILSSSNASFYDFLNSGLLSSKVQTYFTSEQLIEMYELATRNGMSTDEIIDKIASAIEDYKDKLDSPSIENLTERLGVVWLD